jgi:radical SAM protein with 4Fe4S-binding SPASM domain
MQLRDNINLLSKISPGRCANAAKVVLSYYFSKVSGKAIQWGLPISIAIEPTTSCNLRCPECPSGKREFSRPTGMLKPDFFKEMIDAIHKSVYYLTFYFQGEPYLNPDFLDMVNYASEKKIYTSTSTNAHFLNDENARKTVESGLDRLIISIDGTSQEVYESYRIGGDLEKVIQGTKNLIKWKKRLHSKTPHLIFQFLVVRPNEHQINEVIQLARDLGIDELRFKTAQVYDYLKGNPLIPENGRYSRYRKEKDGTFSIKNNLDNHCWRLWSSTVITWDGLLVPCCFDKDARHQMGDLKKYKFQQIWKNTAYSNFRSSVLRSRKEIDICSNCTEGTKVWA